MDCCQKPARLALQETRPTLFWKIPGGSFGQKKHKQILKARNTKTSKLQLKNWQDRACRIELADLGLKFPLVKSILLGGNPKSVVNVILRFASLPGKLFFRWTWTSILLPKNWVSGIFLNIWRDKASKWTHQLLKEGNNLERSQSGASWGCYPRSSGGESNLIKKVPMMERLPWRMSTIEHW